MRFPPRSDARNPETQERQLISGYHPPPSKLGKEAQSFSNFYCEMLMYCPACGSAEVACIKGKYVCQKCGRIVGNCCEGDRGRVSARPGDPINVNGKPACGGP